MDFMPSLIKVISSLVFVLGMMVVTAYIARRFMGSRIGPWQSGDRIRVLGTSYLGIKKQIALIQVGEEYLVLGVTPNHISLLTRMDELPGFPDIPESESPLFSWRKSAK